MEMTLNPSKRSAGGSLFTLLVIILSAFLAPQAPAVPSLDDESFSFSKGTRWTYEGKHNGTEKIVTQEVLRVSTGDFFRKGEPATVFHLAVRTLNVETERFELDLMTSYLALEGGYLVTGSQVGPPVRIYKLNARKGDAWACIDPRITGHTHLVFTHLGEEDVTVPAGTFKNARHVQLKIRLGESLHVGDLYIVPGIGIIKSRTHSEGDGKKDEVVLELKKFSPAREY